MNPTAIKFMHQKGWFSLAMGNSVSMPVGKGVVIEANNKDMGCVGAPMTMLTTQTLCLLFRALCIAGDKAHMLHDGHYCLPQVLQI
jgi:hypothetical protein